MMNKRILIIEDDKDISDILKYNLEKERGISVLTAATGDDGLKLALDAKPHLIILDVILPGMSGTEVCRTLRLNETTRKTPIVMLTALASESDKVLGLELGADDYITKPFAMRELLARIRAALRRRELQADRVEVYDDRVLYIDFENYQVRLYDRELKLTFKECSLLKILVGNAGRVLSRDKILDAVWGYNYYGESRTVDVHIRRIRKKLGAVADDYIETVIGVGYRFRPRKAPEVSSQRVSA
jgi:two-component system, OmpR family, alkaline phosphatase synthesis response regulator PhoP